MGCTNKLLLEITILLNLKLFSVLKSLQIINGNLNLKIIYFIGMPGLKIKEFLKMKQNKII